MITFAERVDTFLKEVELTPSQVEEFENILILASNGYKMTKHQTDQDKFAFILAEISEISGLSINQLKGKCRKRNYAEWRAIISYITHKETGLGYSDIGKNMFRDHATVMYQCRKVKDFLDTQDLGFMFKWNLAKHLIEKK